MSTCRLRMNVDAEKIGASLLALLSLSSVAWSVDSGQIRIPARSATPLFAGQSGRQKSEIHFDPATALKRSEKYISPWPQKVNLECYWCVVNM